MKQKEIKLRSLEQYKGSYTHAGFDSFDDVNVSSRMIKLIRAAIKKKCMSLGVRLLKVGVSSSSAVKNHFHIAFNDPYMRAPQDICKEIVSHVNVCLKDKMDSPSPLYRYSWDRKIMNHTHLSNTSSYLNRQSSHHGRSPKD